MQSWRLILDRACDGATNMGIDEAMLVAVDEGKAPPTIRLYGWSPGCYSLGRFQPCSDLNEDARSIPGITWVRRPTGGRALYHSTSEVTYSIAAPLSDERVSGSVTESYRKISSCLVAGLRLLGADVQLAPKGDARLLRTNPACSTIPSQYELTYMGRKLIGSAQTRTRKALLQHGSIPLTDPQYKLFMGLSFPDNDTRLLAFQSSKNKATCLQEALGFVPEREDVEKALIEGFSLVWQLQLCVGDLTSYERQLAGQLANDKYRSLEWSCKK